MTALVEATEIAVIAALFVLGLLEILKLLLSGVCSFIIWAFREIRRLLDELGRK